MTQGKRTDAILAPSVEEEAEFRKMIKDEAVRLNMRGAV